MYKNRSDLLLAIDLGTSACKIAVFAPDGEVVASSTRVYEVLYPAPGWAEQNPDCWWEEVCKGIRDCLESGQLSPGCIASIGVDGQSWSCIPIDREGAVLHNTPIWMDTRAASICDSLAPENQDAIFSISGNPFKPSYTTPKILWFQQNMPDLYRKTHCFLQSNSFIVHRLTGQCTQDLSQGYGLHIFDIAKGTYSKKSAKLLKVDLDRLPPLFPCHAVVGAVTDSAARQTGLLAGTPVVAGGLDAACGTLGAGVARPGQTQEQGGQAGGMSLCLDKPVAHRSLILSPHVIPGQWLLQGGTVGGGASLRWLAQELGQPEQWRAEQEGLNAFALLDQLAETVPPGSDGLLFLPYLAGERSPIWDPHASGVFFGLTFQKTRAHLFRALLEGVAFSLLHNLRTVEEAGVQADTLFAMGGAANSRLWTQIKADVTGKTIVVPASDTATVLGTAILAGMGVGIYSDFQEAVHSTVQIKRKHLPNKQNYDLYQTLYPLYIDLYKRLKPTMEWASKLQQIGRSTQIETDKKVVIQ